MAGRSKKVIRWPFIGFGRRFEAARPGDQWVSDLFAFTDLRFGRVDFYLRFDPRGFVRYDGRTSAFHVQVCDANSNLRFQLKCTAWLEGVDGTQSRTKSATFNFKGMNIMGWESFLPSEQLAPFEDSPTVFLCCRMSMDVEKVGEPTDETTAFQWEIPDLTERSRSAALKPLWWSPYFHVEKFGAVAFRLGAFPAGFPGEEDDAFELFVAVKNLGGDSRVVFQHSVWLENATGESTPKLAGIRVLCPVNCESWVFSSPAEKVRQLAENSPVFVNYSVRPIGPPTKWGIELPLLRAIAATFDDEKHADFEIVCGQRTFKVSKRIVLPQSPVFSAMFSHGTDEKREKRVTIKDARPADVKRMLQFLYTGEVDDLRTAAFDLLPIADRYDVKELVDLCVDSILTNLNAKNVAVVVHLAAALGHIPGFRANVLNFFDHLHSGPGGRTARRALDRRHPELQELLRDLRE